jgi:glutamate synthase domain-containing protein 3
MTKVTITKETKQKVQKIIDKYNKETFDDNVDDLAYYAEYKGKFLYLKRKEFGKISPIARLTYTGDFMEWDFAIYKWSREQYDPDEWFFPGVDSVDGTIEGAMKAGLEAYPI